MAYTTDKIPTMTSNSAPSGTASADTEYSATYEAWKAMNDTNSGISDAWVSADAAPPHHLQYQFTAAKTIQKYTIAGWDYTENKHPVAWILKGSNNGTDWTNLDTQTGQSFTQAEKKEFTFGNGTPYTYYKLDISESQTADRYVAIGEFELMEKEADGAFLFNMV